MSFLIENWYLLVLALVSGIGLALPVLRGGAGLGLQPQAAVQRINRDKAVVIDVCEPGEYAAAHITGARNVPLAQLEAQLPNMVKNKATPVILVCQAGARSGRWPDRSSAAAPRCCCCRRRAHTRAHRPR